MWVIPHRLLKSGKPLLLVVTLVALLSQSLIAPFRVAASTTPTGTESVTAASPMDTCNAGACLFAGPRIASVDSNRGALINALTSALLGNNVNVSVLDWNSLAGANLDMLQLVNALQTNLTLSSPEAALNANITLAQLISAATTAAQADGNTAAVTALGSTLAQVQGLTGTIRLSDLVQSEFPTGSLAGINLDILSLVTGAVSLYNYKNVATTPQPIALDGSTLGIPGVGGVQLYAQVVEPPIIKCGRAGTQFYSAAVRLKINASVITSRIGVNVGIAAVSVNLNGLSVYIDVARTQGTINFVNRATPQTNVNVQPGAVNAYIGTIADNIFFNRSTVLTPAVVTPSAIGALSATVLGETETAALTARAVALGTTTSANLVFTGALPQGTTVGSSSTFITNLISTLFSSLTLDAQPQILGTLLTAVLNTLRPLVVNVISPIAANLLTTLADPLLDTLGIGIGESDVRVLSVNSNCPVDLGVAVQVDKLRPNVGDTLTFNITVTNYGITDSTAFDVRGLLPSNVTFVSATPSAGTYTPATGTGTTGYMPQAAVYTLVVKATVKAGTAGTVGTLPQNVQSADLDSNPNNNSASTSFTVNRPPLPGNDALQVQKNTSTVIAVLNNDTDPDGTIVPSTVTIVTPPAQGSVTVNPNGTITYNAPANFTGTAFSYRVCDNDGGCSTATVNVGVALGVVLDYFRGEFVPAGVWLEWATMQETGNLGFDILRATTPDAEPQRINAAMIPSQATGSGQSAYYEFTDTTAEAGTTYWYWLEMISVMGDRERYEPIMVSEAQPTAVELDTLVAAAPATTSTGTAFLLMSGLLLLGVALRRRR